MRQAAARGPFLLRLLWSGGPAAASAAAARGLWGARLGPGAGGHGGCAAALSGFLAAGWPASAAVVGPGFDAGSPGRGAHRRGGGRAAPPDRLAAGRPAAALLAAPTGSDVWLWRRGYGRARRGAGRHRGLAAGLGAGDP